MGKFSDYLDRYLVDKRYSITIREGSVHIINYLELEDFSSTSVTILYDGGRIIINGKDLIVSKILNDELLIIGKFKSNEV